MNDILDRIRELSKKKNITLKQLEADIGFGNKTIFAWNKSAPSIDKVIKVADYFDVSLDLLCGREKELPVSGQLMSIYSELNADGQDRLLEYGEMLLERGEYKKCDQVKEEIAG